MDVALWIAQGLAALVFGFHGWTLLGRTERARERIPWSRDVAPPLLRLIGAAEILGAVGLIAPAATRILPWLTPLAAVALFVLMALAAAFHITRREWPNVVFNSILGALAAFVAYGRYAVVPLA